jgi:hypothetical protein
VERVPPKGSHDRKLEEGEIPQGENKKIRRRSHKYAREETTNK